MHADPPVPVACLNYACPTIRERPQPIELKGARHPAGRGMHVNLVKGARNPLPLWKQGPAGAIEFEGRAHARLRGGRVHV